ncbi:hypothetical protein EGT07_03480 [Herbaspirillum sp. HC18]|nr:hypothetical protein EGT07_03480 [Herbaspirillum sp. HC18]
MRHRPLPMPPRRAAAPGNLRGFGRRPGSGTGAGVSMHAIYRRLHDSFIEVIAVLTIPYTAYIAAESLHVSGVLPVVAAGLVRGRYAPEIVSAEMRIMARSVWNVLVFILNSLIFILIGVRMSGVMDKLHLYSLSELFMLGSVITLVAVAVRFAWVFPVA